MTKTAALTIPVTEVRKGDRFTMEHRAVDDPRRVLTVKRVQAYKDTVVVWWVEGNHTVFNHPRTYGVRPITVERA